MTLRAIVLLAVLASVLHLAEPAFAIHGQSTPGANVIAGNPGTSTSPSSIKLRLTAHSEKSDVAGPTCRPQDQNLDCWGSLVLEIPDAGGLSVRGLDVHRVAIGVIDCGEDEDGESCGGDHDNGGCEEGNEGCQDGGTAAGAAVGIQQPVQAAVSGVGILTHPGNTGLPTGTRVQVKFVFTDNGNRPYADLMDVQVSQFVPGPSKPELYQSGSRTIQQVQLHTAKN